MPSYSWPRRASAQQSVWLHSGFSGVFIVLVLLAGLYLYHSYSKAASQLQQQISQQHQQASDRVGQFLRQQQMLLQLLHLSVLNRYQVRLQAPAHSALDKQFAKAQGRYQLTSPSQFAGVTTGSLTGQGTNPQADARLQAEMDAVLALTPLMYAAHRQAQHQPWIYYTSSHGFLYLFPAHNIQLQQGLAAGNPMFAPALYQMPFYQLASASSGAVWTPVYQDSAGQGQLVSVSQAVMLQQELLGVLSLDVNLSTLERLITPFALPQVQLSLQYQQQVVWQSTPSKAISLPVGHNFSWFDGGDTWALQQALVANGWQLKAQIDKTAWYRQILSALQSDIWLMLCVLLGYLFAVLALSQRHSRQHSLEIDPLTDCYRRSQYLLQAERDLVLMQQTGGGLGLMLLDVDYLHKYNQHAGIQAGDQLLARLASELKRHLALRLDVLIRMDGDQFACLMPADSATEFTCYATRLQQQVQALAIPHPQSPFLYVTISVGACWLNAGAHCSADDLLLRAQTALQKARLRGRNQLALYDPTPESWPQLSSVG